MAGETTAANYSPDLAAPSISAPYRLDEGYSDETRSQVDKELAEPPSDDGMPLPDWLLANSEEDRAEIAYSLLRTLSTSTVAALVDRLAPVLHMDPVVKLPPEITSEIFSYLDPKTLLTASLASRAWQGRIIDSGLWRGKYIDEGWRVDIEAIRSFEERQSKLSSPSLRKSRLRNADTDVGEPKNKKRVPPSWLDSRTTGYVGSYIIGRQDGQQTSAEADTEGDHLMSDVANDQSESTASGHQLDSNNIRGSQTDLSRTAHGPTSSSAHSAPKSSILLRMPNGGARINWLHLYKQRRRLEENWNRGRLTKFQIPHPEHLADRDRTVRVWNIDTQRLRYRPLVGHSKSVLCLQFDPRPSEDIIMTGSSDKSVILWRFSTGEKLKEIAPAHQDSVLNLKFDERYLVTCSKDRLIKVWNRRELMPGDKDYPVVHHGAGSIFPAHIVDINELPSPITETELAKRHIRNLAPYSLLMTIAGHGAAVNAIQISEDEIISASGDRLIKIWNIRSGVCKKTLVGHDKGIACVQFDGRRIISGSNDDSVRIFDHSSGAEVACLTGHADLVRTVQAGFGDPPGAEEAMKLEALAVDNEFLDARRSDEAVDYGPRALRRAGHRQNTAGSRNPKDIKALGAHIPPGGGGSKWARIVSGSYDELVLVWKKDRDGAWVVGQPLSHVKTLKQINGEDTDDEIPPPHGPRNAFAQQAQRNRPTNPAAGPATNRPQLQQHLPVVQAPGAAHQHHHHHAARNQQARGNNNNNNNNNDNNPPPSSRVFKVQFDARKIVCATQDPRIVVWDFADDDEEIKEASQFFTGL
ncbi:F-box and WD domain protein [Aspergillus nomiae NRRL 13137]|uniref:Probable E3 ubiquitin ligase complex SCF subunit sconB n=1 Tax=Aspergillus nomiae NRRL (strain ATCC 15546 / NRRL 13137 / CBS 260.88 / M93) TaxID=1509407 RepID=A0A0L1J1U3_ASPN3|nr:F-box and WD domain protein [Aspergillus nomiae NRRL 13137]KNG85712.1 F-box and WD domain protein [Aspergillus nomiae NRRL 13137]